ncbi:hypothetical protein UFOVP247_195 [uncultured Caudovirales phage]|uniref:Uncharacterized protein n=1 Tax=uncultured Caudovirales phage TaxID=2100421 RepID=A0A6J7WXF3_9CAUD|nr:hypothetical protein UFOVP247_195 [uncultured Caudovirales phage]
MKKTSRILTYMILVAVALSLVSAIYEQNWPAIFANISAIFGWLMVLQYEKKESKDETFFG